MYEGYLSNFSAKDGSLNFGWVSKQEGAGAIMKEQVKSSDVL
jgi:hypothetical protein